MRDQERERERVKRVFRDQEQVFLLGQTLTNITTLPIYSQTNQVVAFFYLKQQQLGSN